MQTNKKRVFDFIKLYFSGDSNSGVSTKYIAETLNMQRTNVSSILGTLIAEGKIQKTNGRPVLYYINGDADVTADTCFSNLVGYNGSLKRAVQLAKAAVLYPQKSLPSIIIGARGTGKKFFASLMHKFAVENNVILPDAMYVVFDCKNYTENEQLAITELFGEGDKDGCFAAARNGVLFIDNAHLPDIRLRSLIISQIEKTMIDSGGDKHSPMVIVSCDSKNRAAYDDFASALPIVIKLPPLGERPMCERMELIQKFFTRESAHIKKTLCINAELLRCLLLYDCEANIIQLKGDIKIGCANAYVRERNNKSDRYQLFVSDFEHHVRKGFLKYKMHREEIEKIIPLDYSYSFSEEHVEMSANENDKRTYENMYDELEHKAMLLSLKGLEESDIKLILSADVENRFLNYQREITKQVVNKEQLSLQVNKSIIDMVEEFLNDSSIKLGHTFSSSVFYGLCLHLNASVNCERPVKSVSSGQIADIVNNFQLEYSLSLQFASKLEHEFKIKFPIDEVVLITMFISYRAPISDTACKPVVLFAFYGAGVAASVADVVLNQTHLENVFSFEIVFEKDPEEIYNSLKQYILNIDRGKGVIVVYDGSLIGKMLISIEEELKIVIRQRLVPITAIGIEFARRAALDENIDSVYQGAMKSLSSEEISFKKVIVTLCTTGEGGAKELKRYIQQYGHVDDMEIIPLSISDKDRLREELIKIMNNDIIHCVIGACNPNLFALPFIPISDIFGIKKEKLPELLRLNRDEKRTFNYDAVFRYLEEQLEHINVGKLKKVLPQVINEINDKIYELPLDSEVGLFVHIACCVDRISGNIPTPENVRKNIIIEKYNRQFKELLKLLKPIEKAFNILISDDEIANILTIIYKL
jgi:transcriptional regulatory protein LevR/transcriptional regulator with AAA-type ATPase domain